MKKGQGNIIAWVLLVGFTISLAVLVGRWSLGQAGQATESIVGIGEADIRCESAAIGFDKCISYDGNVYTFNIKNKGSLKIWKVRYSGCGGDSKDYSFGSQSNLGLNEISGDIGCQATAEEVSFVPFIKIEEKFIACSAKGIDINLVDCTEFPQD